MDRAERDLEEMQGLGEATLRPSSYRAHALLVAGMHRTGTSALTRVLSLRGLDLPRHLAPGVKNNNDLGFWESVPVAEAHDRFLATVGSAWDDVSPIRRTVFSSLAARAFAEELESILRAEYGDSTLFVVKDPRLCRLIPVWIEALERFAARPSFVITTRNPLEVAASLKARDGFSVTKSCLLWLRHLVDAEHDSRGFPRVFVTYERLLRDWVATTDRIARELHLFWHRTDHETSLEIEDFLSSELRHHSFDYSELRARSDVAEWVKHAFEAVSRAATTAGELDTEIFDEIRRQLDRADQAYGPLLAQARAEVDTSTTARLEAESQMALLTRELAERQDELAALLGDSRRVAARLLEETETVVRLHHVLDALAKGLDQLIPLLVAPGDAASEESSSTTRPSLQELFRDPRQTGNFEAGSETEQEIIDRAIASINELLRLVDDDRARLLSGLTQREVESARRWDENKALVAEARKLREGLHAAGEERDQLLREYARVSATLLEKEEALAQRAGAYDAVRADAMNLAAAFSDTETQLAEALCRLDSAAAEVLQLGDALHARDVALAGALERVQAAEREMTAREAQLEGLLSAREEALSEAHDSLKAAEDRLWSLAAELDQAHFESERWLGESERLSVALDERDARLAELRRASDVQGTELVDTRIRLEAVTAQRAEWEARLSARSESLREHEEALAAAHAENGLLRRALIDHEQRLTQTLEEARHLAAESARSESLREHEEALAAAHAENGQLRHMLIEHEQRLTQTLEEARHLAAALADDGEVLSRRSAELRRRNEELRRATSELTARDELLVSRSVQIDDLSALLRAREEALATQTELLARLDQIARGRGRRWRSFTQLCSWLFPPTVEHWSYFKAYLDIRRSGLFDADYYLSRYPDVSCAGLSPLMHYIEHGRREGRVPMGPSEALSPSGAALFSSSPSLVAPPAPTLEAPFTAVLSSQTRPPAPELRGSRHRFGPVADNLGGRLSQTVSEHVPAGCVIAIVTGGDEQLPRSLPEYTTWHFPRGLDGTYRSHEASGDTALIANLEAVRAAGAEFLLVPASQRSLLSRAPRFRAHLLGRYATVLDTEELGVCVALRTPHPAKAWRRELDDLADWIERETTLEASVLDWDSGLRLCDELTGCNVFAFTGSELPHVDRSVDVVAVVTSFEERLAEAARVARHALLEVPVDGVHPQLTPLASFADLAPTVSVVVPCYEQLEHTEECVRTLVETLPTWFRGEVLIVDDASSPDTVGRLQHLADSVPYVSLLRNESNAGFLACVNRAVDAAAGEFIVLLNNDTIPLPGWLPPLLAPFRTRDDVGAVGGRLVYPDGRLQEAGGLVFRDGSAAKFGYGDPDPDFPLFTVPREVDYCSGCLLAFRRAFFLESGGFDPEYGFGFYEDTDFCFRVRSLGLVVLYEPDSVIVHVEGASAGTDLTKGAKRFQELNASLFKERWREPLMIQHERPPELNRKALQQLAKRAASL